MKESIENMNRFIEDTTHELNTPISTILTNIELLETLYDCEDNSHIIDKYLEFFSIKNRLKLEYK